MAQQELFMGVHSLSTAQWFVLTSGFHEFVLLLPHWLLQELQAAALFFA